MGCALLLFSTLVCLGAETNQAWFQEIEIFSEPAPKGHADYSIRFTPARTHRCTRIVFECVYQQKFPWKRADGKRVMKIHEPARFSYTRKEVKAVNDLDLQVSFRVPVSLGNLQRIYGKKTFNAKAPVTVARVAMTGYDGTGVLWSYELKAPGKHSARTLLEQERAAARKSEEEEDIGDLERDVFGPGSFK